MAVNVNKRKAHLKHYTVSLIREGGVLAHLLIEVIFRSLMTGASFSTNLYIVLWLQLGVFP